MQVFTRLPLDLARHHVPQGIVFLIPERCKGCGICIRFCPRQVLIASPYTNAKGYHLPAIAEGKESECVQCDFCTTVCPEFAIFSRPAGADSR